MFTDSELKLVRNLPHKNLFHFSSCLFNRTYFLHNFRSHYSSNLYYCHYFKVIILMLYLHRHLPLCSNLLGKHTRKLLYTCSFSWTDDTFWHVFIAAFPHSLRRIQFITSQKHLVLSFPESRPLSLVLSRNVD